MLCSQITTEIFEINIMIKEIGRSITSSVFNQRNFPAISPIRSSSLRFFVLNTAYQVPFLLLTNSHYLYVLSFLFDVVRLVFILILFSEEDFPRESNQDDYLLFCVPEVYSVCIFCNIATDYRFDCIKNHSKMDCGKV